MHRLSTGSNLAAHSRAAAFLRRDAQSGAVAVGDIHALHRLPIACGKEVFHSAVDAALLMHRGISAHGVERGELSAVVLRYIVHLLKVGGSVGVEPLGELCSGESGHTEILHHLLQLRECHSQERRESSRNVVFCFFHFLHIVIF